MNLGHLKLSTALRLSVTDSGGTLPPPSVPSHRGLAQACKAARRRSFFVSSFLSVLFPMCFLFLLAFRSLLIHVARRFFKVRSRESEKERNVFGPIECGEL